jgi:adenosylhomocysteinase
LLGEGRLVNLACAEGHPSEVMQMSFANQALSSEYIVKNAGDLEKKMIRVPEAIDRKVARLALKAMGKKVDVMTPKQKKYVASWEV